MLPERFIPEEHLFTYVGSVYFTALFKFYKILSLSVWYCLLCKENHCGKTVSYFCHVYLEDFLLTLIRASESPTRERRRLLNSDVK